jgi:hypothetical protein
VAVQVASKYYWYGHFLFEAEQHQVKALSHIRGPDFGDDTILLILWHMQKLTLTNYSVLSHIEQYPVTKGYDASMGTGGTVLEDVRLTRDEIRASHCLRHY